MRWETIAVCSVCVLGMAVAIPLPQSDFEVIQSQSPQVPLDVQERLHTLQLEESALEQVARDKRTIAVLRQLFPGISQQTELNPEDENQVIGAESQQNEVRLLPDNDHDQELAASGGNDAPDPANVEAASDDSASEESDRNKRLINFSLGGGTSSSGGSGGGSGNFLFDIIRLVAGSGNTEPSGDGAEGADRPDGYQPGIPGPITRLFVIANRGIANLIQDLILRIAQTSERIVNYKARLITAII